MKLSKTCMVLAIADFALTLFRKYDGGDWQFLAFLGLWFILAAIYARIQWEGK